MKAVVAAFNQEKALIGAFSVIVQPVVELTDRFTAIIFTLIVREEKLAISFGMATHLIYCDFAILCAHLLNQQVLRK